MKQKEVKIIGLKINHSLGILQSCELAFNPKNELIAIKGEVGSGKTTLQKSLSLATQGSDTLKDDKLLYGKIDEEVQLLDGDKNIFIGCKSNDKGSLDYVIYQKDKDGKINKNPVIDGVKLTPSSYLRSLQTSLTWRMDDLMSENPTVQKKLLLDLFKSELADLGVVFDKSSIKYKESILGRIELAEIERSEKEFLRKQVGGFLNQLEPLGIDIEKPDTHPSFIDISVLESSKNELQYKINNVTELKQTDLDKLKNVADSAINKIKEENIAIKDRNEEKETRFNIKKEEYQQNLATKGGIQTDLKTLKDQNCIDISTYKLLLSTLDGGFKPITPQCEPLEVVVQFNSEGKLKTTIEEIKGNAILLDLFTDLSDIKKMYREKMEDPLDDTTKLEKELESVVSKIEIAKENNLRLKMLESFQNWQAAHNKVIELRNEYANLLSSVDTGVEGLKIMVDKGETTKLDIYLEYNGAYDTEYFNNKNKEFRKLSSYSGTQKPLICLLLQHYLLSKKPKAMRYLWIDNVPIDNKTKSLLERMGNELGVTIIVNITGDFTKDSLQDGEILIDGGEIFFK